MHMKSFHTIISTLAASLLVRAIGRLRAKRKDEEQK